MNNKALIVFIAGSLLLASIFFFFPINLFDGVVVYQDGLAEFELEQPLSLSYFIGLGYDAADMTIVKDFYLTPKGWIMAFIFIFGLPGLIAYRISLSKKE